jgi:BirA family transcriptional regulator, biotin operon repressor / biotin---[acetyl-CoA-carboxylase] ligase
MYDLAALESSLAGTLFAGKLHFVSCTDSTNLDALAAARQAAPHGSVYFADEQTGGRGRGDHGWTSAPGDGLYVTVLFRPQIPLARLTLLPLVAGLAAADAIRTVSGLAADLRWPNDVLIGKSKAVGILVESKIAAASIAYAVVGIGINVHQRAFPPSLATSATSLDLASGRAIPRQALLVSLLKSLEREADAIARPGAAEKIPARVEQASTWMRGRSVRVHGPQACQGITAGLDNNGFLRVRTAEGLVTVQTGGLRDAERLAASF